jgi:hypothetical protein
MFWRKKHFCTQKRARKMLMKLSHGVYENGANEVVMTEIMVQKKLDHQICSIKSAKMKRKSFLLSASQCQSESLKNWCNLRNVKFLGQAEIFC